PRSIFILSYPGHSASVGCSKSVGKIMPSIATSKIIVPNQCSTSERQQITEDLYAVHCHIFDGVEKASFAKYVVESKATQTAIHVHKNEAGVLVGYFAWHVFEKDLRGQTVAV